MTSYYSIVRYVPDPIADERINIGVIVVSDAGVMMSRFLPSWRRAQQFGGEDLQFLREFVRDVQRASGEQPRLIRDGVLDAEALNMFSGRWKNSIQLSSPAASLRPPDTLLSDIAGDYLKATAAKRSRGRSKRAATGIAKRALATAIMERTPKARIDEVLQTHSVVAGKYEPHSFDVVGRNGRVLFAAMTLSFEVADSPDLRADIDAAKWAVSDVRDRTIRLPLAVVALPPKRETHTYRDASRVFEKLGAPVVSGPEVGSWASDMAKKIKA